MKTVFGYFCIGVILFSVMIGNIGLSFSQEQVLGAKITTTGNEFVIKKRVELIAKTLKSAFFPFSYQGLSIFIDSNQIEPRGQIRGKEMQLSAHIATDAEFIKLFTHELGHFIDIYFLRASNVKPDPSLDFYKISWKNSKTKHASSGLSSFVSGYAATNQYEDFAESFVWYIFHNEKFLDAAMKNEELRQKYLFFVDNIFTNAEFIGTDFSLGEIASYNWDTTKVPILFQNYLKFLE